MSKKFEIVSREILYQDQYRTFKKLNIARDGVPGVYTYLADRHFVGIIALSETHRTPILRQYRFPIDQEKWEICCGTIDGDEAPEITAIRKLQEETGLKVNNVIRLGQGYSNAGMSDARVTFFLAHVTDAELDQLKTPENMDEILELKVVSLDELDKMAERGELVCGATFMALYHVHRYLREKAKHG